MKKFHLWRFVSILLIAILILGTAIFKAPEAALAGAPQAPAAWANGAANTPPMGWNSYDAYNWNVTEAQVKAAADYMAANLSSVGWKYIVVDWAWYYPGSGTGSPNQTNLSPTLRMDANGRLLPDLTRFPSASGTNGFKPLADYIHGKGLKFGVHMMRGIPRQAVSQNVPILGTSCTANQINNSTTAAWLNLMWGLNMSNSCSQTYLNSVFSLLATWGVDFVKIDDIAAPTYYSAEIEGYKNAITNSGRTMVLSLSPGPTSTGNSTHVMANANMWRVVNDLWDNWSSLDNEFGVLASWVPYRATGAWPDPDMIPIGHLSLQGPAGSPRVSGFTTDEKRTLMNLWVINRSPLIWGGNLVDNTAADLALMNNAAVIAVDQNSTNNRQLVSGMTQAWAADIPSSTDKYVALFNRNSSTSTVSLGLSTFGATSATVTDLWSGASLGQFTTTFSQSLPAHGSGLYRLVLGGSGPTATPVPTSVPGANFLSNANMESGTTNWVVNGAGTLSSDTSQFHGGTHSVKITGRTASWNGPSQNVAVSNFPTSGQNYTVSVWVRSETGTPTAIATVRLTAGTTTYVQLASAAINSTGWTQLTGTVPVSWSGTLTGVLFYVETAAGTDNIYIDDANLHR